MWRKGKDGVEGEEQPAGEGGEAAEGQPAEQGVGRETDHGLHQGLQPDDARRQGEQQHEGEKEGLRLDFTGERQADAVIGIPPGQAQVQPVFRGEMAEGLGGPADIGIADRLAVDQAGDAAGRGTGGRPDRVQADAEQPVGQQAQQRGQREDEQRDERMAVEPVGGRRGGRSGHADGR
ncbi:MAG: hypothetical protein B7Z64_02430 [Acidiphilium sp. 21-68-69]|nr:MAG: hypothetical protein B7Z64_02430 [Acidiphilium sp. 21-68-69]